jgi:hypothetical protein
MAVDDGGRHYRRRDGMMDSNKGKKEVPVPVVTTPTVVGVGIGSSSWMCSATQRHGWSSGRLRTLARAAQGAPATVMLRIEHMRS